MEVVRDADRAMFHNFPRRSWRSDPIAKGLRILELISEYGLLLTPEITTWKEHKLPPIPSEEYTQVARRCCFTELPLDGVPRHASYFGLFAMEYSHRTLIDLGAIPVMYIPTMTDFEGYGVGPAFVTQLANIQDLLERLNAFVEFANTTVSNYGDAPLFWLPSTDGGVTIAAHGTPAFMTVPKEILDRACRVNPEFKVPVIPPGGAAFGMTLVGLLNAMRVATWGTHKLDLLLGMVKGIASAIYPTERPADPLLSYYMQREWRLLGGVLRESKPLTGKLNSKLRKRLLKLDRDFFGRQLTLPRNRTAMLVDECEVYESRWSGEPVVTLVQRVWAPQGAIKDVQSILPNVDVREMPLIAGGT